MAARNQALRFLSCALLLLSASCKLNASIDANEAPRADAGPDQVVMFAGTPVTVTLNGAASSDRDGKVSRWVWQSVDPSVTVTVPPATPYMPTVTLGEGRWGFNLWVQDDDGAISDPDQVVIAVGVELEGPLSGVATGEAGAPAPVVDVSMFNPDQACLDASVGLDETCAACVCTPMASAGCSELVTGCAADPMCKAVYDCSIANGCTGSACYTGGCMAEIDAASGGDPLNNCNAAMPASSSCAASAAISACRMMNCAAACGD